jgi:hypothetical protein
MDSYDQNGSARIGRFSAADGMRRLVVLEYDPPPIFGRSMMSIPTPARRTEDYFAKGRSSGNPLFLFEKGPEMPKGKLAAGLSAEDGCRHAPFW